MGKDKDGREGHAWIPSKDALAILQNTYGPDHQSHAVIHNQAAAGLIASRCRLMMSENLGPAGVEKKLHRLFEIERDFWEDIRDPADRLFADWLAGDFTLRKISAGGTRTTIVRVFGVEFCENDVRNMLSAPTEPERSSMLAQFAKEYPDKRPRLPDQEIRKFSETMLAGYREAATEMRVYRALCGMYMDHSIARDHFLSLFRSIRGPKPRGRTRGYTKRNG